MPAVLGQQPGDPLADRAGAAEHERLRRAQVEVPAGGPDGGGGGGVRAVRVEHDRHAQPVLRDEVLPHLGQHRLAGGHVRPADEDGGAVQVLRPAGEDAAVDERHHVRGVTPP